MVDLKPACLAQRLTPPSLALSLSLATLVASPAPAQITPDATLGNEGSVVVPDRFVRGDWADRIEGGAIRDSNLFHSFLEFQVNAGQRVYFANPDGIDSILSRITGGDPSHIFGTLGVDGPADLFLLNPNGILFGENAQLDIEGSFFASTAEAIGLGGEVFSAVEPGQSRLLTVNPNVMIESYLSEGSGDIETWGQLVAGNTLGLAANQLELQGQIAAGGDLRLVAQEAVQIQDAVDTPFVALAGGDLLVQGNQQVEIVALSHPESGLYAYGDLVLRSANPVGGDAHYWSGGDFRVEQLDGSAGDLVSPLDPIIRSGGDVVIDEYEGASLHILAGGSVTLGTAIITGPEPGDLGTDFLQETIALSDGTVVEIDGAAQPTLDVRAGVDDTVIGTPPPEILTGFDPTVDAFSGEVSAPPESTSANITVGDVWMRAPGGLVLLSNQYQPNLALAEGDIRVTGAGLIGNGINAQGLDGQPGGTVVLDGRADIAVTNSFISTTGSGEVGDVVLLAEETVSFSGQDGGTIGAFSNVAANGEGTGGDVRIQAHTLDVRDGAQLGAGVFGQGTGGDVLLTIADTARFVGTDAEGIASGAFSAIGPDGDGTGGNVDIQAHTLEVLDGAGLSASVFGQGEAGNVILAITDTARFVGTDAEGDASGAFSVIGRNGEGIGGNVEIRARTLEMRDGAQLETSVFGQGDGGNILLTIAETARFVGTDAEGVPSGAFSRIRSEGAGTGGNVEIQAHTLEVLDGAQLSATVFDQGDGGNVLLTVVETARFVGTDAEGDASGAFSGIGANGEGTGGNVEIQAHTLEVLDGAQLSAAVFGQGEGGDVRIQAHTLEVRDGAQLSAAVFGQGEGGDVLLTIAETARFVGTDAEGIASGAFSAIGSEGDGTGGDVRIQAHTLEVLNGAQLSAAVLGQGEGGDVILEIAETARFVGTDAEGLASGALSSVEGEGTGGDVRLQAQTLEVLDGAQLSATVFGQGEGGDVILEIAETARFVGTDAEGLASGAFSRIEANGKGAGGDVRLQAQTLEVLDGAVLGASVFGQGEGGDVILEIAETARFVGTDAEGIASGAFSAIGSEGEGTGGNVEIQAQTLEVLDGAQLDASVLGEGEGGDVILAIAETARFVGPGGALSSIQPDGEGSGGDVRLQAHTLEVLDGALLSASVFGQGEGGDVRIQAHTLEVRDGAQLSAAVFGQGEGGDVILEIAETARFVGDNPINGSPSGAFSSLEGAGTGGNVEIQAHTLEVLGGAQLQAGVFGQGEGGDVILEIAETARFVGTDAEGFASGAFSAIGANGAGTVGDVRLQAENVEILQGAILSTTSLGRGDAGDIVLVISDQIWVDDGTIQTAAVNDSGGDVNIRAGNLILRNNGDIQTVVARGEGQGGNITIIADFVIALDDSDILAFAPEGRGGNIDLSQTIFFGENASIAAAGLSRADLLALDGNDQVDINATGGIASGQIAIDDSSFLENGFSELSGALMSVDILTAASCLAGRREDAGSFTITGRQGLPQKPGDAPISTYALSSVQPLPEAAAPPTLPAPDGVYQLADGRLVLRHDCEGRLRR